MVAIANFLLFLCSSIYLLYLVEGKVYEPCELAQEMITYHRFPKDAIADCKNFSTPFVLLIM